MKVLGTGKNGSYNSDTFYIVQISHAEVCKVMDKMVYGDRDKLPDLKVGEDFPIGDGYDFRKQICDATRKMEDAYRGFAAAAATMHRFASLVEAGEQA